MKYLVSLLVATLFLLILGCIELPPTESSGVSQKISCPITKEVINLYFSVNDPVGGSFQVIGEVCYMHEIVETQEKSTGIYLVRVQIEINAELCGKYGMVHLPWEIIGSSDDYIYISKECVYILQKAYPICNRDECFLVVQYLVTTESLGIPNMWIDDAPPKIVTDKI
ncbi:MAG: hypothetical protein KJN64_04275 [Ignavibacteria bacterium]|nr:hypothetical protein [Ignavibacteria bacterium]MBT8390419.1 hypothetical protein [Ignavibacteria bacterium]NNJ52316.1 hypothetical protein [Ignavibacteriaceae bacterium]NNL21664.1 hypothetical protein [Ignavibacteriaceae bacterium]